MAKSKRQTNAPIPNAQLEVPLEMVQWVDAQIAERPAIYDRFLEDAQDFVVRLRQREEEFRKLAEITDHINRGNTLDQVLDNLYEEAKSVIPYDRIGFSLIDRDRGVVVARWARSEQPMALVSGYEAPLAGSTLQKIAETGSPRIINDLEAYLRAKPSSQNTSLVRKEGIQSSLTCPLVVQGVPVGFLFFSSVHKNTYSRVHVAFFQQLAGQLATIVEKGRLYSELARQKETIEKQKLAMDHDLELARQVQQALIPRAAPAVAGIEIAFVYEPAVQVGGDVLDIVPLSDGRVLFFIGDAMGHGVRAALVMSIVKTALHAALRTDPSPAAIFGEINRVLTQFFSDYFVTAVCCLLDPRSLRGEFSLAGHAPPILFRASTAEIVAEGGSSLPLGIVGGTQYAATPLLLAAGDAIVLSTDGIVEAFDPNDVQYGDERLQAQVRQHGHESSREICAAVRSDLERHCKDRVRQDDLTLLVVKAAAASR